MKETTRESRDMPLPEEVQLRATGRQTDPESPEDLTTAIYAEFSREARKHLRAWNQDFTLETTAIVRQACSRLESESLTDFRSRAHFLLAAARAMRYLLVNYAQKRLNEDNTSHRGRREPEERRGPDSDIGRFSVENATALVEVDKALNDLEASNREWTRVVDCLFFGGMSTAEAASALGISQKSVRTTWALAQAWLYQEIKTKPTN